MHKIQDCTSCIRSPALKKTFVWTAWRMWGGGGNFRVSATGKVRTHSPQGIRSLLTKVSASRKTAFWNCVSRQQCNLVKVTLRSGRPNKLKFCSSLLSSKSTSWTRWNTACSCNLQMKTTVEKKASISFYMYIFRKVFHFEHMSKDPFISRLNLYK